MMDEALQIYGRNTTAGVDELSAVDNLSSQEQRKGYADREGVNRNLVVKEDYYRGKKHHTPLVVTPHITNRHYTICTKKAKCNVGYYKHHSYYTMLEVGSGERITHR